jgi:hypothetical protein
MNIDKFVDQYGRCYVLAKREDECYTIYTPKGADHFLLFFSSLVAAQCFSLKYYKGENRVLIRLTDVERHFLSNFRYASDFLIGIKNVPVVIRLD